MKNFYRKKSYLIEKVQEHLDSLIAHEESAAAPDEEELLLYGMMDRQLALFLDAVLPMAEMEEGEV